jgi:hypothetical protein
VKTLSEILGVKPGSHNPNSNIAKALKRAGVTDSREFRRIRALPRRKFDPNSYPDASPVYAKGPCGVATCHYCKGVNMPTLRPIQSAMLIEASQNNGLFASAGVGAGKTLASLLMHDALSARRTVLFVPPNLRDKTLKYDVPDLVQHFHIPPVYGLADVESGKSGVYVIAYSEISQSDASDLLDKLVPDLVVADEAHNLRHKDAARTRRFLRFMRKNPCRFVAMSGSMTTRSILDFAHLLELALGARSPLPSDYPTLMEWADAIDNEEAKSKGEGFGKTEPGVLMEFCEPGETVRDGVRRRIFDTAGALSTTESACGANLIIRVHRPTPPLAVLQALGTLASKWAWDGEEFDKAIEIARVERSLTQGFFYRLIWPGGVKDEEWLEARNAWKRAVRSRLSHTNREGQDSPALLEAMAERGEWVTPEWLNWQAQCHKPEPGKVAIEVSRWLVVQAQGWAKKGPGIIWVDSPVVGAWLAEEGIPFYGEGADKDLIECSRGPDAGKIVIACSQHAHGTGKNLQAWNRNLILYPFGNGAGFEQQIGRTHRPGQIADDVYVDLILASHAAERAWEQAQSDARFAEEIQGQPQKLNLARLEVGTGLA